MQPYKHPCFRALGEASEVFLSFSKRTSINVMNVYELLRSDTSDYFLLHEHNCSTNTFVIGTIFLNHKMEVVKLFLWPSESARADVGMAEDECCEFTRGTLEFYTGGLAGRGY